MEKEKYIEDIREIKEIMNRSSQFISLSGLSGVSTGLVALIGSFSVFKLVFEGKEYLKFDAVSLTNDDSSKLLLVVCGTLILSIISAFFFTQRKTKKATLSGWSLQSKRLLINLLIPLLTGGVVCIILFQKGFIGMLPPLTLIFYGLALVNGSKYSVHELRNLGIIQIVLGLLAFQYISAGLLFWALGFGVVQIIYGLIIQRKY